MYGYGGYGMGYGWFDPTMILLLIGMALSMLASAKVQSTFAAYSRVRSKTGMTGAQAAERIGGGGVRILLGQGEDIFRPLFLNYGRITGATRFAAFVAGEKAQDHTVGYMGEAFILEATALGLGTCWVGGSFRKSHTASLLPLEAGERIVAITPLGISGETYVGRPRKSLEALTGLDQAALQALPEWQQSALSCARLAPSAVNRQPWRFQPEGMGIRIVKTSGNFGFGGVDLGIAMLHMELGAAHCSVSGQWQEMGDRPLFVPESENL